MTTNKDNKERKLIAIHEKDPNYTIDFVTDALVEGTPNDSMVRLTFFEEFQPRPDAEISGLDLDGNVIPEKVHNIYFDSIAPIDDKESDSEKQFESVNVKRVEKSTLIMTKESIIRLKDWLNRNFE